METIKQKPGSKDCLSCVAAMATDTTPEEYKQFCSDNELDPVRDMTFLRYVFTKGYFVGVPLGVGDGVHSNQSFDVVAAVDLSKCPAYVVVESDSEYVRNQGATHAVYYDGSRIHDPYPGVTKPNGKYKVINILPIIKDTGHIRWKNN